MFASAMRHGAVFVCLALAAVAAPAQTETSPFVESFSPQGEIRSLQQIAVRFSHDMAKLGEADASPPLVLSCEGTALPALTMRWVDTRRWVAEFKTALPAGVRCQAQLREGLQTLAGAALRQPRQAWHFSTGGPKVDWSEPGAGARIKEDQVFLLHASAATSRDALAQGLRCVVGTAQHPVKVLSAERAREEYQSAAQRRRYQVPRFSEADTFAVSCAQPLPNGAPVRLLWGKEIASPQGVSSRDDQSLGNYTVRPLLRAELRCVQLDATEGCDPRQPIRLEFTEEVALAWLNQVVVRDAAGAALPVKVERGWNNPDTGRSLATERSPSIPVPAENSVLVVTLPEGLADVDGRSLSNRDAFPRRVRTSTLPPYVGFAQGSGVLPYEAGKPALWPLAVRRTEKAVPVKLMRMGGESLDGKAPGDALAVRAASSASALALWRSMQDWPQAYETPPRPYPVSAQQHRDWAGTSLQNVPTQGAAMEFVPLALAEPGLYLAEAHSSAFAEQMAGAAGAPGAEQRRPQQRAALVVVTNLNISTRIGHGGESLVWITALDSGLPVAGVSVDVMSCKGRALAQGDTDANGLLRISQSLTGLPQADTCADRYGQGRDRVLVVARKGKDLALLVDDSGSYRYSYGSLSSIGYTILDRMLFKAGDTVHMQHLVRKRLAAGFGNFPAETGKVDLHFERELVASLPLAWDAAGQAVSQWTVPANARLGTYRATVTGPDGSTYGMHFSVEEFRAPVFEAALAGKAVWRAGKQSLPASLSLAFMAGGAAAQHKVELQGRYILNATAPVPGYSFADVLLARAQEPPFRSITSRLDAKGKSLLLVEPPVFDRPATLFAEMKFADPSGEVQTIAQRFVLWHSDTRLGVRVVARPDVAKGTAVAVVGGLVLDASDKPLAGRKLAVSVRPAWQIYESGYRMELAGHEQAVCAAQTDLKGQIECEAAAMPPLPEPRERANSGWLFRIQGSDGAGKAISSSVFVSQYELHPRNEQLLALAGTQPVDAARPVQISVRAPFLPATLLLTVERESVLDTAIYTLTQPVTTLPIAVRPEQAPNVQVHARFMRGLAGLPDPVEGKTQPLANNAVLSVGIQPTVFALDVKVEPGKAVLPPRTAVSVKVTAVQRKDQSPAAGAKLTMVAVDEALLALSPNPSWNLLGAMMRQRGIQVHGSGLESQLARSLVFGAQPGFWPHDDRGRSVIPAAAPVAAPPAAMMRTSDGSEGAEGAAVRNQFSTLAFWSTELALDAQGQALVTVPFNDSLTRWRIVAVVQQGAQQFGTGEAGVQTTQPVQIFSGLPPVVRSGDRLVQQVTLRNGGPAAVSLQLKARVALKTGAVAAEAKTIAAERTVRLAPGQSQPVSWSMAVPQGAGALAWRISAATPDGRVADSLEVEQAVLPALPVTVRQATLLQVKGQASLPVVMPSNAQPQSAAVGVALQESLVDASLAEVRQWMAAYPHACLEQDSSKAVVAGDVKAWDTLMADLPRYLDANGLARYFPENSLAGSETLTAHLLDVAAAKGWAIPAASRTRMLAGLQKILRGQLPGQDWMPSGSDPVARQLSLQATLIEQRTLSNTAALPVRPEDPGSLPTVALTDWVRALLAQAPGSRSAADLDTAAALLRSRYDVQGTRLNWRNEDRENWWWFMWSGDLAAARTALVLQQWQALDPGWKDDVPLVVAGLTGRQQQGRWSTTAANAWATIALQRFAASVEGGPVSGSTQLSLVGEPKAARTVAWPKPPEALLRLEAQPSGDTLLIKHQGSGAPWATVSIKAAVRLDKPHNAGMRVEKTITAVEQKIKGQWSVGDVARIRLTMHSQADLTWVVVHDPVPSGATILGRGLGRESALAQRDQQNAGAVWPSYVERAADSYKGYYRWVPRGSWSTEYTVRINNAGEFRFPATRLEAMYAPEIFAETPNAEWVVKEGPARR